MESGPEYGHIRDGRVKLIIILAVATYIVGTMVYLFARSLPQTQEIRGVLIDVQSREIVNADAVTLRDEGGVDRTFRVSPEVANNSEHPNSASHLRQHMMLADPVIIRYHNTADGPVAVRILDAGEGVR